MLELISEEKKKQMSTDNMAAAGARAPDSSSSLLPSTLILDDVIPTCPAPPLLPHIPGLLRREECSAQMLPLPLHHVLQY